MLKKRIIFALLYQDGFFCLSRNFRLQKVGDINWLLKSYNFEEISGAIDELVILNLSTNAFDHRDFILCVEKIQKNFFIPITLGGNVRKVKDADRLFSFGADKIVLNTLFFENSDIAAEIVSQYGSQAVIASVDYKKNELSDYTNYMTHNREQKLSELELINHLQKVQVLGCGEILARSVERDGTGNGLDLAFLDFVPDNEITVPLIIAGGIGKSDHMIAGLQNSRINAVCTANLLNFMNKSLLQARRSIESKGLPVAKILD